MSGRILWAAMFWVMLAGGVGAAPASNAREADTQGLIDHGPAAPIFNNRFTFASYDKDGRPLLMTYPAETFSTKYLLLIDPLTGALEQMDLPGPPRGDAPFAAIFSSRNRLYTLFGRTFLEFDPAERRFTFWQHVSDNLAMRMTEDDNGIIWAGVYPKAHLYSFNPDTRELIDHGAMNKESWPQYPRGLACDDAGWVYAGIGATASQLVARNPDTGQFTLLLDESERRQAWPEVFRGSNGRVYARPTSDSPWLELYRGERREIEKPPVARVPMLEGAQGIQRVALAKGPRITQFNITEKFLMLEEPDTGKPRRVEFDYHSDGAYVKSIIAGPDGRTIYGSTGLPLRVISLDTVTGTLSHQPGQHMGGHLNALALQRGHIIAAQYSGGYLYDYDTAKPIGGTGDQQNPRRLNKRSSAINRPHALLALADGRRVIMVGTPDYGLTGGGMLIYDLESEEHHLLTHEQLIRHHSTVALAQLPDGLVVGGTTIVAGTGGQAVAKEAELYLFDPDRREVVWHAPFSPSVPAVRDLVVASDGLVHGLTNRSGKALYFVFDPARREVVHQRELEGVGEVAGNQAPRAMLVGSDGMIYCLFRDAIGRITPGSREFKKLVSLPTRATTGLAELNGRLYFSTLTNIWSWPIPPLEP